MALSNDLISQFVKITNDRTEDKSESTVYGTIVEVNGSKCVRIDGSDIATPIQSTTSVGVGDRVTVMIKNHTAIVTGNLSNPSARYIDISDQTDQITRLGILVADKVDTKDFVAEKGRIDNLVADNVLIREDLIAQSGTIKILTSDNVTIKERLTAAEGDIGTLKTEKLSADSAVIKNLQSDVAGIDTLIFGSATGTTIQSSFANAVIAQLGDAQIKSAMIQSISAGKITSGDIITNNVKVKSSDGRMIISDQTMQISDAVRVRVQIGKDASNDYSINVWDASGNLMFSKGGITDAAIKTAIIRNDMVSETANISASKLDIDSLFEEINGSTKTIKSTKVYLDENKQTLDVVFKSLSDTVTSQGTAISVIQGQITSKVWQQDINTATGEMSTQYSTLSQELSGFKTTVSSTYATNSTVQSVESTFQQTANGLTARLNDMRIGGRNLIVRSTETVGRYIDTSGAEVAATACSISVYISINPSTGYVFTKNTGTKDNYFRYAWYTSDKTYIGRAANANNEFSWTSPSNAYYVRISYPSECKVKFEKGTMATDWSPAPEDVASDILAASKSATNYLNFSTSGLVVGNHTATTLSKNVLIDSEAVKIRTGTTVNAVFGGDIIELAKDNDAATISMLKGAFKIYYDADNSDGGFGVYGLTSDGKERLAFQPVNENNNLTLGWGGYADKANSTNLYGHKMYLTTNEDIILNPGSGNVQIDGNIILSNGKNLFGTNTAGALRAMAIWNANNQLLFGYGSYSNSEGTVFYDGNDVSVRSKKDIRLTSTTDIIADPGSGTFKVDGNIILPNAKILYGMNAAGTTRSIATLNASNQLLFGYGSYSSSEGTVFYDGNDVNIRSKNDVRFTTAHEVIILQDGDGNATYNAFFRPESNAKCTLGTNANRWYAVYAANATIQTSDIREKENVIPLSDAHSKLFDRLKPVQYNFIEGTGKLCYGLIAQDVLASMSELGIGEHDLDLVHHDTWFDEGTKTEKDSFGVAYANLIAMLIHEVQKLKIELNTLKTA